MEAAATGPPCLPFACLPISASALSRRIHAHTPRCLPISGPLCPSRAAGSPSQTCVAVVAASTSTPLPLPASPSSAPSARRLPVLDPRYRRPHLHLHALPPPAFPSSSPFALSRALSLSICSATSTRLLPPPACLPISSLFHPSHRLPISDLRCRRLHPHAIASAYLPISLSPSLVL